MGLVVLQQGQAYMGGIGVLQRVKMMEMLLGFNHFKMVSKQLMTLE
jgi:hypothetical protein